MNNADLMTLERQEQIVGLVNELGRLTVAELSQRFGVSETTIRRDLAALTARSLIRRTHGGVVRLRPVATSETPILQRQHEHIEEKERIGTAAARLVRNGETLLIVSGSTGLAFARCLEGHSNLTVITDSLLIANELLNQGQHRVIILGGTIDPDEQAVRSSLARAMLKDFRVDKVFIGTRAASINGGLSAETPEEAEFFKACIDCGQNVILITDSSKFHVSALVRLASLEDIHTIVTDAEIDGEIAEQIRELGIYLILV